MQTRRHLGAQAVACILIWMGTLGCALFEPEPLPLPPYAEPGDQFHLELPQGWTGFEQMKMVAGVSRPMGMIIFSGQDLEGMALEEQARVMARIDGGEEPSFFVDRLRALGGMGPDGFSDAARRRIILLVGGDPMFGAGRREIAPLTCEPEPIAGCTGYRLRAETETPDGTRRVLDMHAVSDGAVLYLFTLRNRRPAFDRNLPVFERTLETLRLEHAKSG